MTLLASAFAARTGLVPLLLAGSVVALAGAAAAQCGGFTSTFGAPGFETPIRDSLVHDDGSGPALFLAGDVFRAPGIEVSGVARWDGTTLQQLGAGIDARISDLYVFDDGSGIKLAAGGAFRQGNGYEAAVALWDGQQWTMLPFIPLAFGDVGTGVASLALFDAGSGPRLFAGGDFGLSSVKQFDGTAWQEVGGNLSAADFIPDAFVTVLRVFDLGNGPALYAGGRFQRTESPITDLSRNVAVYTGGLWTSLGSGVGAGYEDEVNALEVFDDGSGPKLVAGGRMRPLPVGAPFRLAQWDGVTWTPFAEDAGNSSSEVTCLRAFGSGSGVPQGLWVGGTFEQVGNLSVHNIARWDGTSWHDLGGESGLVATTTIVTFDDQSGHGVRALAGALNGAFEWLENGRWSPAAGGGGADAELTDVAVLDLPGQPQQLFVAGYQLWSIGGIGVHGFARFDGTRWWNADPDSTVSVTRMRVLDAGDGAHLYASGAFAGPGGTFSNLARLDGGTWTLLPSVPTATQPPKDLALFDDGTGQHLFASGSYGLWRLDGNVWSNVLGSTGQAVTEMLVFDDGSGPGLFLAGSFQSIGGMPYRSIARWNGTTLDAMQGGTPNQVRALCAYDDGSGPALYAGGSFVSMSGVASIGIARWNGQSWSQVRGLQSPTFVFDLFVHDDGSGAGPELVATGRIPSAGGSPAANIVRWNGTQWRNMDGGLTGSIPIAYAAGNVLAAFDDHSGHGPELFVAGLFTRAGGLSSSNIARWQSCGGDATTFCFGDGSGTACPCGNASAPGAEAGCLNSLGVGGTLRAHGRASLSDDTLVLDGGAMTNSSVLYYQGANLVNGGAGVVFGDGVKCTAGPFVRLGTRLNVGGASSYPGPADPTLSVRGQVTTPGTRHYQVRYRNSAPFCTPDTFNYTSGVSVAWSN